MLEVLSVNGSSRVRRRRFFLWLAPVVLASIAIPAARSDAAEQKVSENTVTEGLKTIERAAAEIAEYAGEDKAKAQAEVTTIKPVWELIEHTIRANDNDAYVAFEKAIDGLEAAANADDGEQAEDALKALGEVSKSYSSKSATGSSTAAPTPGQRSAAAAAPVPDAAPAAAEAGDAALARTGSTSNALAALAGLAFALGGLAIMGGARRTAPLA
jgi:hypothetical protein